MSGPLIKTTGVSVTLGRHQILKDISLSFAPGAVHFIVGPNGGGKTTLLRALLNQVPCQGDIAIGGAKAIIGYAPQSLDFDNNLPLTVADVIASMISTRPVFLRPTKETKAKTAELLDLMDFGDKATRAFGDLSGGERQRVLLCQAFSPWPNLLILDEATVNLDGDGVKVAEALIGRLREEGATILWVSHDLAQIRRMADSVTVINGGAEHYASATTYLQAMFPEMAGGRA